MVKMVLLTLASLLFWFVATVVKVTGGHGNGSFINPKIIAAFTLHNPWYWAVALLPVGAFWFWSRSF